MKRLHFKYIDPLLLGSSLMLICIGLIMVYSSSNLMAAENFSNHMFYLERHIVMLAMGCIAMMMAMMMPLHMLKKLSLPILLICVVLLGMVVLTSFGVEAKHATRWVRIAGFRFQPSELIKPWFILFVAGYLERMGPKIQDWKAGLAPLCLMAGVLLLLIYKQPDFGTAVTIATVTLMMIFVSGAKIKHMIFLCLSTGALMGYLIFSADYRRRRFLSFLNPWADPQGDGFQIIQSLIAFERGGLMGQGLGDGTQKLLYLPEAHTDFIFSVIGEEIGLMGCAVVVILFFLIMVQGIRLAIRIQDQYASLLAFGITILISIQAIFNMGVVMGLLPTKGLTLPLVSYGGSSLISTMFCLGMLLSLSSSIAHQKRKAKI